MKTCLPTKREDVVVTPRARMTFVHLTEPNPNSNESATGKKKYQVSLLIPGDADLTLLKKLAETCAREKWGDKMPKKLKTPFLNAGDYDYEGYEDGMTLIRANTVQRPGIVDARGNTVDAPEEVYSGRWCRASLRPFTYDRDGNRGVSFGLQNVQLLDHDEPLGGGRAKPEDEFAAVEDDDDVDTSAGADSVFG